MELSYAELFLLAWALASSVYALLLRDRHIKFVEMGTMALEMCKCVIDDVADGKVTVKRVGDNTLKVVNIETGE